MSGQTSPPGKTFEERWPDDVAEANFLAGPWIPVALGGLAGLFGVPVLLSGLLRGQTVPFLIIVIGALALASYAVPRTGGKARRRLLSLWKVAAWVLLASGAGILIGWISVAVCDAACAAGTSTTDRTIPTGIVFITTVAASVGLAMAVDRMGHRLPRREPATRYD
ncbi:MAG TPA: hypothetical protein VD763_01700 [Candidatus Saccharimonadales bacterium]|nr:hypothetical protein [Candidatus Saccharimonadales bacterium]